MRIFTMKSRITLLQLDDILPMAEHGIWIRINGKANYISNNDVWNLILKKYGEYIVYDLNAEGPLNDGGNSHVLVSITESKELDKKLEEAGW